VSLTLTYDPDEIPDENTSDQLFVYTLQDGVWMRLPSEVDADQQTVTAQVNHFSVFSWGLSRLAPDYTVGPIVFRGRVEYSTGRNEDDIATSSVGALRYAVHDEDWIVLHEGVLDSDGSFEFTLPEGVDVGLRLNPYLQVYSVTSDLRVASGTSLVSEAYSSRSATMEFDHAHMPNMVDFGTFIIPHEESGAFKILATVERGLEAIEKIYPEFIFPQTTVVWGGESGSIFSSTDTGVSGDLVVYIGNDPQAAHDEDEILRAVGQYVLYLLNGEQKLYCSGSIGLPDRTGSPCYAWKRGWTYFFSAFVRGEPLFEAYQNRSSPRVSYNLEEDSFPLGERSTGAVMSTLWEITASGADESRVRQILKLMRLYGDSIDDFSMFYDSWEAEYGFTEDDCQAFVDHEIVRQNQCDVSLEPSDGELVEDEPEDDLYAPLPATDPHWLEYGVGSGTHAEEFVDSLWMFQGDAGDLIGISVQAVDDIDLYVELQTADGELLDWDDDSGDDLDALIYGFELPESGAYRIMVTSVAGAGDYIILLDLVDPANLAEEAAPEESPPDEITTISYGQSVEGFLESGDMDSFHFEGQGGDVVTITLIAIEEEFDPALVLLEADTMELLIDNDDADLPDQWPYDAQIARYSLPTSGVYRINAMSIGDDGNYRLTLELEEGITPEETPTPEATSTTETTSTPDATSTPQPTQTPQYTPTVTPIDLGPTVSFTLYNDTDYRFQGKYLFDHVTPDGEFKEWVLAIGNIVPPDAPEYIVIPGSEHIEFLDPGESITVQVPPGTYLVGFTVHHPVEFLVGVWFDDFEMYDGASLHVTNEDVDDQ
jgi:hypothetical protein